MEKVTFAEKVYSLCRQIPAGKVTTYREMAKALNTKAYQAVGQALKCNPDAPHVPCHRVISSNGTIGGFKGKRQGKEIEQKIALLEKEGLVLQKGKIDLEKFIFTF